MRNGNKLVYHFLELLFKVLIVPCGMETFAGSLRKTCTDGINCTLRNGNLLVKRWRKTPGSINCTLRNGNTCETGRTEGCRDVLIVPCGMETTVPAAQYCLIRVLIVPCGMETSCRVANGASLHGINCTLRNGNAVQRAVMETGTKY